MTTGKIVEMRIKYEASEMDDVPGIDLVRSVLRELHASMWRQCEGASDDDIAAYLRENPRGHSREFKIPTGYDLLEGASQVKGKALEAMFAMYERGRVIQSSRPSQPNEFAPATLKKLEAHGYAWRNKKTRRTWVSMGQPASATLTEKGKLYVERSQELGLEDMA